MNKTIGILAHVDAGKTTFSEQVLFSCGVLQKKGQVDHGDSFLDTDPMERARGITIFAGQAVFPFGDDTIFWLDTPGHADFSTETERMMSVMDAAVLLISSVDFVQPHTMTLFRLLESYRVPTFIFLSKCDRKDADPEGAIRDIRKRLTGDILDLRAWQTNGSISPCLEDIACMDAAPENVAEMFLSGDLTEAPYLDALREMFMRRACIPVCAGSGLTGDGVDSFLGILNELVQPKLSDVPEFSARVFRVTHEDTGLRICHMRSLSGSLRVRDTLTLPSGNEIKVSQLRRYTGEKYTQLQEAAPGELVALPFPEPVLPGSAIGPAAPVQLRTDPMMSAQVLFDTKDTDAHTVSRALNILGEEEPSLHVSVTGDRMVIRMMGRIQLDVLQESMQRRFHLPISFGPARVMYRETVKSPVIGIGHYEPLRHYAEVHLRLLPGKPGSGITFRSLAHVDDLTLNWQRLIRTHVLEREHKGVLTGAPLTDVVVELLSGRAHLKHTEGGDFRQATYRAIRNALMQAESVLLEPWCGFEIQVPSDMGQTVLGTLMPLTTDLNPPVFSGPHAILSGTAPIARFAAWQEDFSRLTRGLGSLRIWMDHDAPVEKQEKVVEEIGYAPLADTEHTPDSVFCSHGAGFTVAWNQVHAWAHVADPEDPDSLPETNLD